MCAKKAKKQSVVDKVVNVVKAVKNAVVSNTAKKEEVFEENVDFSHTLDATSTAIKEFYEDVLVNFPTSGSLEGGSDEEIVNRCVVAVTESEIERYIDLSGDLPEEKLIFVSDVDKLSLVSINCNSLNGFRYKLVYWHKGYGEGQRAETHSKFKLFVEPKDSVHNHIDEVRRRFTFHEETFKQDVSYILTYLRNSIHKS